MRSIGCGFVWLLIIALSACSSHQSSLDSQIKEDLNKLLNTVSQKKNLSNKLSKTPPSSGILSEDHVAMYVWVNARAMQISVSRIYASEKHARSTEGKQYFTTDSGKQILESVAAVETEFVELESELSNDEISALRELYLSPKLYDWVKQTIDTTVAIVDSTGESSVVDLVTFYDPVIKHNISLVKRFKEKLQFTNSVQLRINNTYQNLKATKSSAVVEKANLVVWPS